MDDRTKRLTEYATCAGCAAKLPPAELARVLRTVEIPRNADLLVGPEKFSDAGIFRVREDLGLVLTVDFFPPVVDDPEMYGAIAAANALSDCYAMGGRPLAVLCVAGFPSDFPGDAREGIFRGGFAKVGEAGAVVAGGHTVRHSEPLFGFAVTGEVDPRRAITNDRARPGDSLYLTKPLGCGALTTAIKRQKAAPAWAREAMASMATLNARAAAAAIDAGVQSMTDVTGFGLVGHAANLARASEVTVVLETERLPFLTGALELSRQGIVSGGSARNRAAVEGDCDLGAGLDPALVQLVLDAETSGGLLMAASKDAAPKLEQSLTRAGVLTRRVGRVEAKGSFAVRLV